MQWEAQLAKSHTHAHTLLGSSEEHHANIEVCTPPYVGRLTSICH